jgi:hypothetical protein
MHDPELQSKIFTELGFAFVDDGCEGDCDNCETKADCTVYSEIMKFEHKPKKKKANNVVPFRKK